MKKIIFIAMMLIGLSACSPEELSNISTSNSESTQQTVQTNALTEDEMALKHISSSNTSETVESMNKIRSAEYDFDADGNADMVSLYANVEKDEEGKYIWDDFHRWLLEVEMGNGEFYKLFDNQISLGQLYFDVSEVYNDEVMPVVTIFMTSGSGLEIYQVSFEGQDFIERKIYSSEDISTGGINKIYSSIPSYR